MPGFLYILVLKSKDSNKIKEDVDKIHYKRIAKSDESEASLGYKHSETLSVSKGAGHAKLVVLSSSLLTLSSLDAAITRL